MSDKRIPRNFPGGYSFDGEFIEAPLEPGQVWRKHGPVGALKIERILLPGFPDYDGASPGVSCRHSKIGRYGRIVWERGTWFHPAGSQEDFWQQMKVSHRAPVIEEEVVTS